MTAEHGGNRVPPPFTDLFRGHEALLASHRGWDPGTLALARTLADALDAPLVSSEVTRLLVDLNRSPHNPRVFSEVTRPLPRADRRALLTGYHEPHWRAVRDGLADLMAEAPVLHLAIHAFTPEWNGVPRTPDVALLYDPAREPERSFATAWTRALAARLPDRVVRRNDPYRGNADGLATSLRRDYPASVYVGIEVEVNQRFVGSDGRFPAWVASALLGTLESGSVPLRVAR